MELGTPRSGTNVIPRLAAPLTVALVVAVLAVATAQRYGDEEAWPAGQAAEAVAVSTGVYTAEQAMRGAEVFSQRCSGCHGAQLQGGMAPQLAPLNAAWRGLTLGSLYRFVSTNMPYNAPGSLEPQQYADVIAHVLASNGFPPGMTELQPDAEALDAFVIDSPTGQ